MCACGRNKPRALPKINNTPNQVQLVQPKAMPAPPPVVPALNSDQQRTASYRVFSTSKMYR